MPRVRFIVERGSIVQVEVGDYRFEVRNAPASTAGIIENLFRQLSERGVVFTQEAEIPNEKIKMFVKSLTPYQKQLLRLFEERDEVSKQEIENLGSEYVGQKLAGILSGLTRKARGLGIIGEDEQALIWNETNKTYKLNLKLKPAIDLL